MNTMFAELSSDGNLNLIEAVKWSDFIADYQNYVDKAVDRQRTLVPGTVKGMLQLLQKYCMRYLTFDSVFVFQLCHQWL